MWNEPREPNRGPATPGPPGPFSLVMYQPRIWCTSIAVALVVSLLFGACDARLEPYAENTGFFSIYGYLTVSDAPHYIRVRNLNDLVLDDSTQPLDATVLLKNLDTGATETLIDSVVVHDGVYTHNFRSEMDVEPKTTYEVSVERSDGRTSRATATMPPVTNVEVEPTGDAACDARLRVEFPDIDQKRFIRASVGLKYANTLEWYNIDLTELPTGGLRQRFQPASFVDEVVPDNITPIVDCDAARYCSLLDDKKIRIAYTHFGPDWPADSVLADPLHSDVTNGTGVFGGLRRDTVVVTTNATLRCPGPESVPCTTVPRPCTSGESCFCPDI